MVNARLSPEPFQPLQMLRMPSTTYCTASAASSTPSSRDNTMLPVKPKYLLIRAAKVKAARQQAPTSTTTAINNDDPNFGSLYPDQCAVTAWSPP